MCTEHDLTLVFVIGGFIAPRILPRVIVLGESRAQVCFMQIRVSCPRYSVGVRWRR